MKRRGLFVLVAVAAIAALANVGSGSAVGAAQHPLCAKLGQSIQASSGAQMLCFGPQRTTGGEPRGFQPEASAPTDFSTNVNAASLSEDVSPSGARAYGQSEVSIAGVGNYVVEGWNDATGFFSPCPSPQFKEELTGLGFSANGGASFTDLGGAPNDCRANGLRLFGDPSVEAWHSGAGDVFYVSSLFARPDFTGPTFLGLNACKATGSGSTAKLTCGNAIRIAQSQVCETFDSTQFCSFLDKEFLAIDPVRGRLYVSYTEFGVTGAPYAGAIELAVCDIGTASGGTGPAGGTATQPVCKPGGTATGTRRPYAVVAGGQRECEQEGAYPAVDQQTGDVYVAWEWNWATNVFGPDSCLGVPTRNILARVPASCLTLTATSPCTSFAKVSSKVVSMTAAFIPGYNRFPASDFPRIAVSRPSGTVSMLWNDARSHPLGDILMKSYNLGSLTEVQPLPVRVNADVGGMHFLPALRYADDQGRLAASWYSRSNPNSTITDVRAVWHLNPRLTGAPPANIRVTTAPTDWNAVSSDIIPNFGDYTDNYVILAPPPFTGFRNYVAWADGRLGVPQPFAAGQSSG